MPLAPIMTTFLSVANEFCVPRYAILLIVALYYSITVVRGIGPAPKEFR